MSAKNNQNGQCRGCNTEILWFPVAGSGRKMPINAEPDESGNVVFCDDGSKVRVLRAYALAFMQRNYPHQLYKSHFDSCQNADHFRRQKPHSRFGSATNSNK